MKIDDLLSSSRIDNQNKIAVYTAVTSSYDKINKPIFIDKNIDYYLFTEKCNKNANDCYDGLDKYGLCCFVWDGGEKIIKTRYADYPWK